MKAIVHFKLGLILFMFLSSLNAQDDLSSLLEQYSKESDLSKETKQESVGHVSVLTRNDLDMLHLNTLSELFTYVRFMNSYENSSGLLEPLSDQLSPIQESYTKVYIDNEALLSPYFGTHLQYFGKVNLNFIDHVEIYWGVPTFEFGIGTAYLVIKLYTKQASRENTNVINMYGGTYGTFDINGYSAHSYEDFSYLLSLNVGELKRKNQYKYSNYPLKRGQKDAYMYSKFNVENSQITLSALKSKYKNFMGSYMDIGTFKPTNNQTDLEYIHLGYDYKSDDKSLNAYLGISHSKYKISESGDPIIFDGNGGFLVRDYDEKIKEDLIDAHLSKYLTYKGNNIEIGFRGRYKHFNKYHENVNNIDILKEIGYNYNKETTLSFYIEDRYQFDDKNILVGSVKQDNYIRNGNTKDGNGYGLRFGFIHNEEDWFSKTFGYFSKDPRNNYQFYNYYFYNSKSDFEYIQAYSTELGLKMIPKSTLAFTAGIMFVDRRVDNIAKLKVNTYSMTFEHQFDRLNSLKSGLWVAKYTLGKNAYTFEPEKMTRRGGYTTLLNYYGKWRLANTLSYYWIDIIDDDSYKFDTSITYNYTNKLQFYLKGKNLFNDSSSDYYFAFNPDTGAFESGQFDQYDRTLWFGVEYSF